MSRLRCTCDPDSEGCTCGYAFAGIDLLNPDTWHNPYPMQITLEQRIKDEIEYLKDRVIFLSREIEARHAQIEEIKRFQLSLETKLMLNKTDESRK
jgi:hypothetical protein